MIFDYISFSQSLPFEQQVAQNFTSELQWSPNLTFGIVFDGELTLHYEKHHREFKLHDIFFFLPTQAFTVVTSSHNARVLLLSVDAQFLSMMCPDLTHIKFTQNHVSCNLTNPTYVEICKHIATIVFNNLKKDSSSRLKLLMSISGIISALFDNYAVVTETPITHNSINNREIEILKYIDEHYSEKLTVPDIANHLGLHPQYFSTYFRKLFHTNFIDYLNTYRINRSISELANTKESILNIALSYGFNSHKTYSSMFKKLYHCTPMEYRASFEADTQDKELAKDMDPEAPESAEGVFGYFRQFYDAVFSISNEKNFIASNRSQKIIELPNPINAASQKLSSLKMVSAGRAFTCLRSEVQNQIVNAKKELAFEYLRIRDIFSDDMYVYYESETNAPVYNWQALDNVFDFLLSSGIKPFPEIGYMPNMLSSKKQYAGLSYHPNVSAPKSLLRWQALVHSFLTHFLDRYGQEEVRTWYFDFWTSPDLSMKNAYWNESQEEFFAFYKATYDVFQEIDPNLRLGSPNFSTIEGYDWYDKFFQYCHLHRISPAYVSFHCYGIEQIEGLYSSDTFLKIQTTNFSVSDQEIVQKSLQRIHQIMNQNGFRALDVIVSDWNLSFLPRDPIRDTCYMGPYICHTYIHSLPHVRSLCFWALSDIHEDAYPNSNLFTGGPGILDYHGLKKTSYNALFLLTQLGNQIIEIGDNYIYTKEGNRIQILIYNLPKFDTMFSSIDQSAFDETHRYQIYDEESILASILVHLPKGTYYLKHAEINREYGSAYDLWNAMGAPEPLHKELEDYLRGSAVPHVTYTVKNVEETLILDEEIPPHGVLLLELIPKN